MSKPETDILNTGRLETWKAVGVIVAGLLPLATVVPKSLNNIDEKPAVSILQLTCEMIDVGSSRL